MFVWISFEIPYYCNGITGLLPNIFLEAANRSVLWRGVFLGVLQDLCQSSCVGVSFLIKLQAWACDFDEGETLTLLQDFWGCMFYRTPLENCFYFSLKRIENAFSNFLLIISFLLIQTICKSLWTHHIGFKWGFYTLCLLF